MLDSIRRPLNASEKRSLNSQIRLRQRDLRRLGPRLAAASVGLTLLLWLLTLIASDAARWVVTVFWLIIGAGIGLWTWLAESRKIRAAIQALQDAIDRDRAQAIRIRSEEVVEFEEYEDLGACYAFQITPEKIIFVAGQDYFAGPSFPNSDFTIVNICDSNNTLVDMHIVTSGKRLRPVRRIPVTAQECLRFVEHLETIEGRLDDIETLVAEGQEAV